METLIHGNIDSWNQRINEQMIKFESKSLTSRSAARWNGDHLISSYDNRSGNQIMQRPAGGTDCDNQKTKSERQQRQRVADEMTQAGAQNPGRASADPFDAQSAGPLPNGPAG